MAALVTLTQAKAHLRISGTDQDTDITQKILAASAAVLSHIKGRRIDATALTSGGGVATMTTAVPHGLVTGDSVTVWGTVQPEYAGTFTITVVDTTSFTFPVSGPPVSPATGYIGLSAVQSWTDVTVPEDVRHAVLLLLTSMFEHRGDTNDDGAAAAAERLLMPYRVPTLV